MSTIDSQDFIDGVTSRCQVIIGAIILGVTVLLGVAAVVVLPQAAGRPTAVGEPVDARGKVADGDGKDRLATRQDTSSVITWVAVAFAAMVLPMSFVVPNLVTRQNRRAISAGTWPVRKGGPPATPIPQRVPQTDADKLAMAYQTQLIIGAALHEGAAFFAAIAYLIGKDPIALGLGILLLLGLIARFPTRDRVRLWIDRQQEQLVLDQQSAI